MVNIFTRKSYRLAFDFTILPPKRDNGQITKKKPDQLKLLFISCVYEMQMYHVLRGRHAIF